MLKSSRSAKKRKISLSSVILYVLVALVFFYIIVMVLIATYANSIKDTTGIQPAKDFPSRNGRAEDIDTKSDRILTAYLESIDESQWAFKPLPVRTSTAKDLKEIQFSKVNSCSNLMEQWPVDEYPDEDPFLPWIHDVFPSHDGKFIQIVAQNRRRCNTGKSPRDKEIHRKRGPQLSLFQNVAVKRVRGPDFTTPRYRLASHEEADDDGTATRFICRFSNGEETLSVFNFSYEWASYRKKQNVIFHESESDNKQIHTSQILFRCPVPKTLTETVRTGASVRDDFATLFMDLVPIRTPPRFGPPNAFLPPYYEEFNHRENPFNATSEWGNNHILPTIEDSGRWQNIPICKPSLLHFGNEDDAASMLAPKDTNELVPIKQHRLISCVWASAGYSTRGNRFAINDGQRRLLEWITYNKLTGVEHFYVYDNSGAFTSDISLKFVADMFPDDVTLINWPSKICNNNQNNVDNPGERSSQYAAEASCRLRFGPHTDWIAQFDIDEYLVPMGELTSLHPLLDKLDEEGTKIISFGSWRAWPRRKFIQDPNLTRMTGGSACARRNGDCFELSVPKNFTMLQAYNCDRQKPGGKKEKMPAEKQIYRPEYVLHHFIHYSTVTAMSEMNREDIEKLGRKWNPRNPFPDPLSRFGDENKEALMLHTKAVAHQDTVSWEEACAASYTGGTYCRLGVPFPHDLTGINISAGENGMKMNCYVNPKIDDYWVKELESKLKEHVPEIAQQMRGV